MIYLIKLATFCEDKEDITKDTAELVLKIGYTNDDRKKSRFSDYISSGHRIRIIKTIPGGSSELEHRVQKYFGQYRFPGRSQEWFCNVSEIIDAFNSCETAEDLEKFAVDKIQTKAKLWSDIDIDSIVSELFISTHDEESVLRIKAELSYIVSRLGLFTDRLRYLCSLSEGDRDLILEILPIEFSNIFYTIGPENIAKFGYQRSKLIREYQRILNNDNLAELVKVSILSRFVVGERYPTNVIKAELKSIYEAFGYNKAAKATTLHDYFKMKEVFLHESDSSKSTRGFEILSIKQ